MKSRHEWYEKIMLWDEEECASLPASREDNRAVEEFEEYLAYQKSHPDISFEQYHKTRTAENGQREELIRQEETTSDARIFAEWTRGHINRIKWWRRIYAMLSVVVAAVVMIFFLQVSIQLPPFGNPGNPDLNEVARRYLDKGLEETGATNAVAGLILDYRAFDTFGESTVLFAATMSVILLLRRPRPVKTSPIPRDRILQMVGIILLPAVMMYGIYVVLNGHLSPGGGFSGGTVMGCGLILCYMVMGRSRLESVLTPDRMTRLTVGCLVTYGLLKGYSFITGANHIGWEVPKGKPGAIFSAGFILPLNICVGLIVACTMYTFFSLFSEREEE